MSPREPSGPARTFFRRFRSRQLLILTVTLLLSGVASAWWQDDWSYRKQIRIDAAALPPELATQQTLLTVPLRLHLGNFDYFADLRADGADLRVIAADDATPLPFHVEFMDTNAGLAVVWIGLVPGAATEIGLYYGNADAAPAADSAASWGADVLAAYHFSDRMGLPRDATANGHDASAGTARIAPGLLNTGLGFDGRARLQLPVHPRIADGQFETVGIGLWIRPESLAGEATLVDLGAGSRLMLADGIVTLVTDSGRIAATAALSTRRWHHLHVDVGSSNALYVDGARQPGTLAGVALPTAAPTVIGSGFIGAIDELRLFAGPTPAERVAAQFATQQQDAAVLVPGEDASREGDSFLQFGLFWTVLASVRPEGWLLIGLMALLAFLSFDAMIGRTLLLRRMEREDARMRADFAQTDDGGEDDTLPQSLDHSPLARIYNAAIGEAGALRGASTRHLTEKELLVIRNRMDEVIGEQIELMNERLLWMTIAVSGGPFLGLLGTVLGVMITFAAIAAAGDVNVQTIAPGVSAALTTTVAGLLVAIPSLFGYNFVAARIARRVTAMELFSDSVLSRLALAGEDVPHRLDPHGRTIDEP